MSSRRPAPSERQPDGYARVVSVKNALPLSTVQLDDAVFLYMWNLFRQQYGVGNTPLS